MDKLKERLADFWWEFKQDPFGYIFMFVLIIAGILAVAFLIFSIYLACTGQIQLKDTGNTTHGINLIPMYNGDNLHFLPMPY